MHYPNIEKKRLQHAYASQHQARSENNFIVIWLSNGYVERVSRGIYKIPQKGEKLLEILN